MWLDAEKVIEQSDSGVFNQIKDAGLRSKTSVIKSSYLIPS